MNSLTLMTPLGLIALATIPLIILYHMRKDTPVSRQVPATRFWIAAEPRVTDHPRFKLPPLSLPLLLQLLAALLLGLALARPAISEAFGTVGVRAGSQHQILLLDGSASMMAVAPNGQTRYENARASAVSYLEDLRTGDAGTVITMGANPQTLQATDGAGLDALKAKVASLPPGGGISDLTGALALAQALLMPDRDDQIIVLSDGALAVDPTVVQQMPAPVSLDNGGDGGGNNLAVTRFTARPNPAQPDQILLHAQVANFGNTEASFNAVVAASGIELNRFPLTLAPGQSQDFSAGAILREISRVTLTLVVTDILPADDTATLLLASNSEQSVLVQLISDTPYDLQRGLSAIPGIRVITASISEFLQRLAPVGNYDLVVFDGLVPQPGSAPDLPVLFVNPPLESWPSAEGVMTAPLATKVLVGDPLLHEVELAGVTFGDTPIHRLVAGETEVAGDSAGPLIYRIPASPTLQPTIVLPFSLTESNLPDRIAFPILMTNIVAELAPAAVPSALSSGDPIAFITGPGAVQVEVIRPDGSNVELPVAAAASTAERSTLIYAETGQPGDYALSASDEHGQILNSALFTVNAGHPQESNLQPNDDLPTVLATSQPDQSHGSSNLLNDLWPVLVMLGLLIVALEWLHALFGQKRRTRGIAST